MRLSTPSLRCHVLLQAVQAAGDRDQVDSTRIVLVQDLINCLHQKRREKGTQTPLLHFPWHHEITLSGMKVFLSVRATLGGGGTGQRAIAVPGDCSLNATALGLSSGVTLG